MGLFEYRCTKCDKIYKIWRHAKPEDPDDRCNKCGGRGIEILGLSKLDFKGSGFYSTDYKATEVALPSEDE